MLAEIRSGRQDQNSNKCVTVVRAKGFQITGEQMRSLTEDGSFQDWSVVVWKFEARRQKRGSGLEDQHLYMTKQLAQGDALNRGLQIATGLLLRIGRGDELDAGKLPQTPKAGIGSIGCRKQNIGIQEEPIHSSIPGHRVVGDGIGV